MHIYIDESGSFVIPQDKNSKVSCVAALVIPTSKHDEILNEFLSLRSTWGVIDGEVKGSALDETKIAEVISLLRKHDVITDICAIDMGLHSEQQVTEFKHSQADELTKNLTPQHQPTMIEEITNYRQYVLDMPNQLFIQSSLVIHLINRLMETAINYYSQRIPQELSAFHWIVDAKDIKETMSEKWWKTMMLPFIEIKSLKEPMFMLPDGDYTYFDRFFKTLNKVPDHWKTDIDIQLFPIKIPDLKNILIENFMFEDSKNKPGLQLVDIVASAFTRAINGSLQIEGWKNLGNLLVKRHRLTINMVQLKDSVTNPPPTHSFYRNVILHVESRAKPMFLAT